MSKIEKTFSDWQKLVCPMKNYYCFQGAEQTIFKKGFEWVLLIKKSAQKHFKKTIWVRQILFEQGTPGDPDCGRNRRKGNKLSIFSRAIVFYPALRWHFFVFFCTWVSICFFVFFFPWINREPGEGNFEKWIGKKTILCLYLQHVSVKTTWRQEIGLWPQPSICSRRLKSLERFGK